MGSINGSPFFVWSLFVALADEQAFDFVDFKPSNAYTGGSNPSGRVYFFDFPICSIDSEASIAGKEHLWTASGSA